MNMNSENIKIKAAIFDLDGVVTKTASVHRAAWKETFDEYLRLREKRNKEPFKEFTSGDYLTYVDGKPRYKGVKSFLKSRSINLKFGDSSDDATEETVCGIGNKKNLKFKEVLKKEGAEVYSSTVELIKSLKAAGIRIGVASSSKNCQQILESVNLEDLFETRVDGVVSVELKLTGKPEADIFVKAAANLGSLPSESIVFEDAASGVAAGRNGGFGFVVGIARENNETELFGNWADIVVKDLDQISLEDIRDWFRRIPKPLVENWEKEVEVEPTINPAYGRSVKSALLSKKRLVFFLDYDGTLTPIVSRPELAVISQEMRNTIKELSSKHATAIVSGRMREDVENLLGIKGLFYAGSHGFDIKGPDMSLVQPEAKKTIPLISKIVKQLSQEVGNIEGVLVEDKKFSVGVHYRLAPVEIVPQIKTVIEKIVWHNSALRLMEGKKVFEILPAIDWNKGKAIRWIMKALNIDWDEASVVYIGDDTTDEDAFRVIRARGTGILVSGEPKASAADFIVALPKEIGELFERIIKL